MTDSGVVFQGAGPIVAIPANPSALFLLAVFAVVVAPGAEGLFECTEMTSAGPTWFQIADFFFLLSFELASRYITALFNVFVPAATRNLLSHVFVVFITS